MFADRSVSEIRKFREEYAASLDYDLGKFAADLRSRQGKDGRRVVYHTSRMKSDRSGQRERSTAT